MKQITIRITKGGKTVVEAHGYSGSGCEPAVNFYAEKLKGARTQEHKPEYYEDASSGESEVQTR